MPITARGTSVGAGQARSAGPSCPAGHTGYIDVGFFRELPSRDQARDFAHAYVLRPMSSATTSRTRFPSARRSAV